MHLQYPKLELIVMPDIKFRSFGFHTSAVNYIRDDKEFSLSFQALVEARYESLAGFLRIFTPATRG